MTDAELNERGMALRERAAERHKGAIPVLGGLVYVRALPNGRVELGIETLQLRSLFIELSAAEGDAVARRLNSHEREIDRACGRPGEYLESKR